MDGHLRFSRLVLGDGAEECGIRSTGGLKGRSKVCRHLEVARERHHGAAVPHVLPGGIAASE
eukprot:15408277-Alexandrium_andersonii.AAC.1